MVQERKEEILGEISKVCEKRICTKICKSFKKSGPKNNKKVKTFLFRFIFFLSYYYKSKFFGD